jgi:hypothetical protein
MSPVVFSKALAAKYLSISISSLSDSPHNLIYFLSSSPTSLRLVQIRKEDREKKERKKEARVHTEHQHPYLPLAVS